MEKKSSTEEGESKPAGSIWRVLKEADRRDVILMGLGTLGCVADGLCMSIIMVVLSNLMNSYGASSSLTLHDVNKYALYLLYVAIAVGSGAFLEGFCWARTAERQSFRLRKRYLEAVLWQDVGFFDTSHQGQGQGASITSKVVSSITNDTLAIQQVLTEKMANFIMNISMFITAQMAAMYLSWRLAVVAIPALSMLVIPGLVYGKLLANVGEKLQEAYGVADGVVEQTVSSIKTVHSCVGEEHASKTYSTALEPTVTLGIKQALIKGMAIGSVGITFVVWALQGWYGSTLVINNGAPGGSVFSAGVCIIYGGLALGSSLINVKYLTDANIAAARVFEIIDRAPDIHSTDNKGKIITDVKGELQFTSVDFEYPSRPGSFVLKSFNLRVKAGQTVGLVGTSGSGKSTVVSLLERFYDPIRGEILLDGIGIKSLDLKWLRGQMGLVSQEPILFATSIKENILFGKEAASMEEVIAAAKSANAHKFITGLPNGYDTQVGQLGTQMSEGQKQRISIARALLRDPKILLLDEATSALDSHSEKAVQDALDQVSIGRTTIIIAHRFSALRNADLIAVIQSGEVIESGPHNQLIHNQTGPYSAMLHLQNMLVEDEVMTEHGVPLSNNIGAEEAENEMGIQISNSESKTNKDSSEGVCESPSIWDLFDMMKDFWKPTTLGCIGALTYGLVQPAQSLCLGALLSAFFLNDHDKIKSETRTYCLAFIGFAVFVFLTNVVQHYYFGVMGENLTRRVKEALFRKIVNFEIEWFDQEDNNTGAVCSRLVTDATMVRTLVTDRLSFFTQAISGITLAVILGLILSWKLGSAAIAMQPLIIGAFYVKTVMMRTMSKKILKAQNKSSELASEAVANHRIITAFYSHETILGLYDVTQISPKKESQKQSWYAAFGLFFAQFLTAANAGLLYWYGGKLLFHGEISVKHLFQTFFILVSTGRIIAETGSMTSDLSKGTNALKSVFMILKRESKIKSNESNGTTYPEKIKGDIELKQVDFFYPRRPKQMVLKCVSLKIDAGNVVSLVGQSGSGKSTVIRLIERFYNPSKGLVEVDGIDIKCYNLRALRSRIALVSQEPTLFAGSIHHNIAYGNETATEAEIIEAAKLANAHDFISGMKDGYATYCGERGVQLSGGQKQRLAIARAILKNPAVLLLDEATSALDIKSEKSVQQVLEKIMVGKTCLVVAHRLSTVKRSSKISVLDNGRIVEEGSHAELLAKGDKGAYFSLVKVQQVASIK